MNVKTILVPLTGSKASTATMELAFLVAQRFGAHVDVLHVRPDPRSMIPYVGEGMSGALIEEVMTAAEREAGDRSVGAHTIFNDYVARAGISVVDSPTQSQPSASWHEEAGREDEAVARFGRLADLVIVSRPGSDADAASSSILEAALFDTGQPLMLAPPISVDAVGSNILIGWNGSPESARAVSAAIPFLREANSVSILSVSGWFEGVLSIEALANRLAWHGVRAEVTTIADPSGPVGEIVLNEVASRNCDLLVMGAYTQSRLRQMILGGVTRHVLGNAMVPVIMAH